MPEILTCPLHDAAEELLFAARLEGFLDAALEVADAEGLPDDTVLPVWPPECDSAKYPQLTVGLLRRLDAALAKAEGRR